MIVLAIGAAIPIADITYDRITLAHRDARVRLIMLHRLWELQPQYTGKPETWTRFAARLLTDRQLILRINEKYGPAGEEIERDYRRDLAIADAELVGAGLAVWALPLAVVYGLGRLALRRPRKAVNVPPPPSHLNDPRYMPSHHTGDTQ